MEIDEQAILQNIMDKKSAKKKKNKNLFDANQNVAYNDYDDEYDDEEDNEEEDDYDEEDAHHENIFNQ